MIPVMTADSLLLKCSSVAVTIISIALVDAETFENVSG